MGGISSQSHGRVSYASTRQEEDPRAFTVAEYNAMQAQYEVVAPSATIDAGRGLNVRSNALIRAPSYATIGFDTDQSGRANFMVSGPDRNFNGIPDFLEGAVGSGGIARGPVILGANVPLGTPAASIGFDTNYNGNPNFIVTGPDENRNGIPDFLEGAVARSTVVRGAAPVGIGQAQAGFQSYASTVRV